MRPAIDRKNVPYGSQAERITICLFLTRSDNCRFYQPFIPRENERLLNVLIAVMQLRSVMDVSLIILCRPSSRF